MIAALWAKLWGYIVAAAAVLAAIAIAVFYGREKGKEAMQTKVDTAHAAAEQATAIQHTVESRDATDNAIEELPQPSAPQKVADADPASAAGRLRDEGFTRD